jgi:hypothetical protein
VNEDQFGIRDRKTSRIPVALHSGNSLDDSGSYEVPEWVFFDLDIPSVQMNSATLLLG